MDDGTDLYLMAEAIHNARYTDDYPPDLKRKWSEGSETDREYCLRLARAAIDRAKELLERARALNT